MLTCCACGLLPTKKPAPKFAICWPGTRCHRCGVARKLGWKIQDRYRFSYWDALIVAAAKMASCRYLLTEDLQAGQKLDGIEVVNPFLRGPELV